MSRMATHPWDANAPVADVLDLWHKPKYRNMLNDAQIYRLQELLSLTTDQFVKATGATTYCVNWFRRALAAKHIKHKFGRFVYQRKKKRRRA